MYVLRAVFVATFMAVLTDTQYCTRPLLGLYQCYQYHVVQDVDSKMQQELDTNLTQCVTDIQSVIEPVQQLTAAEQSRLETALGRLDELRAVLEDLKQKAANVE